MKWALLAVACVCLLMCCRIGYLAANVTARSIGYSMDTLGAVSAAAASTYTGGAIGTGIIGGASALGAALIQVSENKKKD